MQNTNLPPMVLVSQEFMEEQLQKMDMIIGLLSKKETPHNQIGDWISEQEAKRLLHRSTTWFWQRRQDGTLTGQKRSGSWWYRLPDIQRFIENGKS